MAGPARTITPHPRHLSGRNMARTVADLTGRPRHQENSGLIGALLDGKLNTTGTITLTAASTTSDIDDQRIGTTTMAFLVPLDANAAASLASTHQAVQQPGKIRLTHPSSGLSRTFGYVLLGIALLWISSSAFAQSPSLIGNPFGSDPTCNAGEYYLAVNTATVTWRKCQNGVWSDMGAAAGAGEANTASNLGGGLANWDSKVGVDLRFNSFNAAHFDLAANLISADEVGLEALLDLADLNGLLPLAKITDDAAASKCLLSGGAGDPTWTACPGGTIPTGTGFTHITAGAQDAAAKLVDTADVNADQITYAKMQNVSATSRFLGRITAGAGDTEELTGTQATTLLDNFTAGLKGLAPLSGGGTTNFLRADATWAAPPGGTPGGADTQVQFNDAGAFGGDAQYVWNKTTNTLTVGDATTQGFLDVKCPTPGSMDCETTYVEDAAFGGTPAAGFRKLQARSDGFYEIDSAAVTRRLLAGGSVEVTLDFGASGAADASVVVTGQAWVTATTEIVCSPTMMATADRAEGAQDAILEGLVVAAYSRVAGTGFTLAGAPRFGNAIGKYAIHCVGA